MRSCSILLMFACCVSASAHEVEVPLRTGSELLEWCRTESEAQFVAQGRTPYNFTGSHRERGNTLVVEAHWRVDGGRHEVECQVARGGRREHATLRITRRDR